MLNKKLMARTLGQLQSILTMLLMLICFQALVSTCLLAWRGVSPQTPSLGLVISPILVLLSIWGLWLFRHRIAAAIRRAYGWADEIPARLWLLGVVLLGLVLRFGWILAYPASPASDGRIYLQLAEKLASGQPYEMAGSLAFWPPGYPLALAGLISIFDGEKVAVGLLNTASYVATVLLVYRLGALLAGKAAGQIAALVIALWPTLIAMHGLPEKELIIIPLIALIYLLYYHAKVSVETFGPLGAGIALGAACLIQPSLILFPTALIVGDWLLTTNVVSALKRAVILVAGMAVVISPWTLRNWSVFDEFVLISSNGGYNLYRANNELATGGYIEEGAQDLSAYSELRKSAVGSQLALEWIRENPLAFSALVFEKQLRFLGDDSTGVYASLKRGGLETSSAEYLFWKGIANSYWYILWIILLFYLLLLWRTGKILPAACLPLFVGFLYLYSIHSVFESNGKYHIPVLALLALLVAYAGKMLADYDGSKCTSTASR